MVAAPIDRRTLISYVILTRNRAEDLKENLEYLAKQAYSPLEVVVVVNGPDDETRQLLRDKFSWVRVISNSKNLGVTGGRNAGIKNADGEIIICIDDDAVIKDPSATQRVAQYFRVMPELGALAFSERMYLDPSQYLNWYFPGRLPEHDGQNHFETYYYPGAGHALRASALNETGLYPERYFYSTEEKDLSYRLIDRGYRIWYTPDIQVHHKESPKGRNYYRGYHELRNHIWFGMRHLPVGKAIGYSIVWIAYTSVRAFPRQLGAVPRALSEAWQHRAEILRERKVLKPDTFARMRELRSLRTELTRKFRQFKRVVS